MSTTSGFEAILKCVRALNRALDDHDSKAYSMLFDEVSAYSAASLSSAQIRQILEADYSLLLPHDLRYELHHRLIADSPTLDDYRGFAFWLRCFGPDHDSEADNLDVAARLKFGVDQRSS